MLASTEFASFLREQLAPLGYVADATLLTAQTRLVKSQPV